MPRLIGAGVFLLSRSSNIITNVEALMLSNYLYPYKHASGLVI